MDNQEVVNPIHPDILPSLDPAFAELYNQNLAHIPPRAPDLSLLRKIYSTQWSFASAPAPQCAKEYDDEVDGWERYPGKIKIRVYVPYETAPEKGWPVHINFHGGGWALGDLDTEAHILRHVCTTSSAVVIDVAYRLIPELPFPTGIYDSLTTLQTIHTSPTFATIHNINPLSISLGGFSAGATIALILNHLARDHKPMPIPITAVIVNVPALSNVAHFPDPASTPYHSMLENANAPTLSWNPLKWFDTLKTSSLLTASTATPEVLAQQTRDISWFLDAFTAPNYRDLAGLTYIATASCDPLRDEGEAYGRLLEENGNRVVIRRF